MFLRWLQGVCAAVLISVALLSHSQLVSAQQNDAFFVQIEAQPNLRTATDRARIFASRLPDVNGFALGAGWYGIALGPYTRDEAERVLRSYRNAREIARDSYLVEASRLQQQFWPVGASVLNDLAAATQSTQATQVAEEPPQVEAELIVPDETPAEARRSEAQLTRDEKKALQVALQWAGFYRGAIDGAYGRGTRGSMAAWQGANGFDETGVLTTAQRAALLGQYNAVLEDLDLAMVQDARAGVAVMMPTARVAFEKYDYPFAHYAGPDGSKVLLISQEGNQNTLFGLYDIMQTLDIVPLDGPRERRDSSFRLKGENGQIVSETIARLVDGQVKGFTLVWPAGDEDARTRLLAEMEKSFETSSAVLAPSDADASGQAIDLVSGLTIRKPRLSRSGFFVDGRGVVVTTTDAIGSCSRITLDEDTPASVIASDNARGIAVLRPAEPLAPRAVASFSAGVPRLGSDVAVAGFSYEGVLGAPSMTFGNLSDLKDLTGNTERKRLAMVTLPGDAGGPVLDAGGGVLGMLLPSTALGRSLPEDVQFAANGAAIDAVLQGAGVALASADSSVPINTVDLGTRARDMTVLVSCWD